MFFYIEILYFLINFVSPPQRLKSPFTVITPSIFIAKARRNHGKEIF